MKSSKQVDFDVTLTNKQFKFCNNKTREVLYGGSAGGGKSHGQVADSLLYALKYKGSKQIIFRRTYKELEMSILLTALNLFPRSVYSYNKTDKKFTFSNGSIIWLSYIGTENDVYLYQSAEFDVIRFDELTHFTEAMYLYMMSRLRGANNFPKSIKSTTNPGGVGHTWVKERFIDIGEAGVEHNRKIFIPAKVFDNKYLMQKDPDYVERLQELPEIERKRLLDGDWDAFEGRFFGEFNRDIHVVEPFEIPDHWRRYEAFDFGLDMFAFYKAVQADNGDLYIVLELAESGVIMSEAAERILATRGKDEDIRATFAPPDVFGDKGGTGKKGAQIFYENGVSLTKVKADRVQGWLALKEWMRIVEGVPKLYVFSNCKELIKSLGTIQQDKNNPNDVATEPHALTHAVDALRYLIAGQPRPTRPVVKKVKPAFEFKKKNKSEKGERIKII